MAVTNVAAAELAPMPVAEFRRQVLGGGRQSLGYDGRLGELTSLWLKTLGLTILTLGFYRFWGRTRIRKYLWSRVTLDGDRFEYDGTGGELFRRFVIAVVVLVPLFLAPMAAELAGAPEIVSGLLYSIQAVSIGFLALIGYYAGRRYRLSRTVWRGIRGGLGGSASTYGTKAFILSSLTLLTLGFYLPWQRVKLWQYEANNTSAGDEHFAFDGSGRDLLGAWLLNAALLAGAFVLLFLVAVGVVAGLAATDEEPLGVVHTLGAIAGVAAVVLTVLLWPVITARFTAKWWSYMASNTRIRSVRLEAHVGWGRVLRLQLGNLLILLFTAGLGGAFAAHRTMKFWCRYLEVSGIESLASLEQATPPPKAGAEGLSQLFGESGFA